MGLVWAWLLLERRNHCTPKSRNLELHLTMSVFLLAASLNFKIYWRALLSFPVLANTGTGSGKLWLAQRLKVYSLKHPQGFREGGVPRREGTGSP